jgi:hypothetical protein
LRENALRRNLLKYLCPRFRFPGQVGAFKESLIVQYLTPELLDQEQRSRVELKDGLPKELQCILDKIDDTLRREPGDDTLCYRNGELKPCGSVAEGTKIMKADEFDFIYLIDADGLRATQTQITRTKPRSGESRSYFQLTLPDARGRQSEIKASDVHDDFLTKLRSAVQPLNYAGLEVKKAGPAVKISYLSNGKRIKMDLTLCLKSDPRQYTCHLTEFAKSLLNEESTPGMPDVKLKCHFVAAHDYWKLCFVETEQDLVKCLIGEDPVKGAVYRCVKVRSC